MSLIQNPLHRAKQILNADPDLNWLGHQDATRRFFGGLDCFIITTETLASQFLTIVKAAGLHSFWG